MSWIPTEDADRKSRDVDRKQGFELARVTRSPDNGSQVIEAEVIVPGSSGQSIGAPTPTWVIVPNKGSAGIPNVGDTIVLGYSRGSFAICFGVLYTRQERSEIPSYTKHERVIGHKKTGAEIRIKEEGSVTITANSGDKIEVDTSDGSVRVNDGTNPVAYDVSTTTDGDGHVTSVSLTTSDKLKVPS